MAWDLELESFMFVDAVVLFRAPVLSVSSVYKPNTVLLNIFVKR